MGMKSVGGEIVQVQGGHIIRATGRKDRHSKVFTAKGPRDRRVRLAAHTAIQFYDVQDRLGYDRPSKAVDWLINKAKDSIDKLAELPPWDPVNNDGAIIGAFGGVTNHNNDNNVGGSEQMPQFYVDSGGGGGGGRGGGGMKTFFPSNDDDDICGENSNYPNYTQGFGRGSHQNHRELCLSLHTLEDPGVATSTDHHSVGGSVLFNGFDGGGGGGGWGQQQDVGRFTRLMGWAGDSGGGGSGGEGRGEIMFNTNNNNNNNNNSSSLFLSTMANYGNNSNGNSNINNQRGALQSNYTSMSRDFEDNSYNHNHNHSHQVISSLGHGSDSFMGFYIPSQQIHHHGDLHGGGGGGGGGGASMSNRASSSSLSSDSTHH